MKRVSQRFKDAVDHLPHDGDFTYREWKNQISVDLGEGQVVPVDVLYAAQHLLACQASFVTGERDYDTGLGGSCLLFTFTGGGAAPWLETDAEASAREEKEAAAFDSRRSEWLREAVGKAVRDGVDVAAMVREVSDES